MRPDYYQYSNYGIPFPHFRNYHTLYEAKQAYMREFTDGCRLSSGILGKTVRDSSIFLTFTPFYSDTKTFGRTQTTYIGEQVKRGEYQFK